MLWLNNWIVFLRLMITSLNLESPKWLYMSRYVNPTCLSKRSVCYRPTAEQILRWRPLRKLEMKMHLERSSLSLTSPHASIVYCPLRSENNAEVQLLLDTPSNKNLKWVRASLLFIHWPIQGINTQTYIWIYMKNDLSVVIVTHISTKDSTCRWHM